MLALLLPLAHAVDIHRGPPPKPFEAGAAVTARVRFVPCPEPLGLCNGPALDAGTQLTVTEARKADGQPWVALRDGDRPVGWALASALTGATLSADLDGDGTPERLFARFTDAAHVEVRILGEGGPPQTVDLGDRSDMEGPQETATVDVLPASEAGIPLVRVRWHAREQCGSGDAFAYVSFQGSPPVLREAWSHRGSGGDAPIWWETTASFDPAKKTATTHFRAGEYDDDGGQGVHTETTTVWTLRDGVFTKPVD